MSALDMALMVIANKSNHVDAQTIDMAVEEMARLQTERDALRQRAVSALTEAKLVKLALCGGPVSGRHALDAIKRVIAALSGPEGRADGTPTAGRSGDHNQGDDK